MCHGGSIQQTLQIRAFFFLWFCLFVCFAFGELVYQHTTACSSGPCKGPLCKASVATIEREKGLVCKLVERHRNIPWEKSEYILKTSLAYASAFTYPTSVLPSFQYYSLESQTWAYEKTRHAQRGAGIALHSKKCIQSLGAAPMKDFYAFH